MLGDGGTGFLAPGIGCDRMTGPRMTKRRGIARSGLTLATAIVAGWLLLGGGFVPAAHADQTGRVVIVVIDGPRDTEFFEDPDHVYIPHIWNELRPLGYLNHSFWNHGPTETCAGHASIATGTGQTIPDDGTERPDRPTLWEYYRDLTGSSNRSCVLVTLKNKLLALSYSTADGYGAPDSCFVIGPTYNDSLSISRFITYAWQYSPVVSFISLGEVDIGGHSHDWDQYVASIRRADRLVYALYNGIQSIPAFAGRTAFFITADHGRHTSDWCCHGDECGGCRHLPFLAIGPNIKTGKETGWPPADMRDICGTAAVLLDIPAPQVEGRVMTEMLIFSAGLSISPNPEGGLRIVPSTAAQSVRVYLPCGGSVAGQDGLVDPPASSPAASLWSAALFDAQGRRVWSWLVPSDQLQAGWLLRRPSACGAGWTWLELRTIDGGPRQRHVGEIVWVR